jgi:predicted RNase H-like HicB family nuclease
MTDKYSVSIQWSNEDEGLIATSPELEGLSAFGETQEEAFRELETAKSGYMEVFEDDGCLLPDPDPDTLDGYCGQIRLRMPKSLHARLSREAKNEGVSLNIYLVLLLSERNVFKRAWASSRFNELGGSAGRTAWEF